MLNSLYVFVFVFLKSRRSFISTTGIKVSLILKGPISIIETSSALRPGLCGSIGFLQLKYHVREKLKQNSTVSLEEYMGYMWETDQTLTLIHNPDDMISILLTSVRHHGFHSW